MTVMMRDCHGLLVHYLAQMNCLRPSQRRKSINQLLEKSGLFSAPSLSLLHWMEYHQWPPYEPPSAPYTSATIRTMWLLHGGVTCKDGQPSSTGVLMACQMGSNAPLCFITEWRLHLWWFWTWAFLQRFLPPCRDPCCCPYAMGWVKYPYSAWDIWWGLLNNPHEDGSWSVWMIKLIVLVMLVLGHKEGWDKPPPSPQPRTT